MDYLKVKLSVNGTGVGPLYFSTGHRTILLHIFPLS